MSIGYACNARRHRQPTPSSYSLQSVRWYDAALRLVFDDNLAEEQAAGLAARAEADAEHERHELADVDEVDAELAQQWRVVPDVVEGEAGELAAPAQSQRHSAQTRQELVAAVESSRETRVAAAPHTVD